MFSSLRNEIGIPESTEPASIVDISFRARAASVYIKVSATEHVCHTASTGDGHQKLSAHIIRLYPGSLSETAQSTIPAARHILAISSIPWRRFHPMILQTGPEGAQTIARRQLKRPRLIYG
jgi:hypothetical protein